MHFRYRFAARFTRGKDVLDAGCGTCWGWIHLGDARSLTGLDADAEALQDARRMGFADRVAGGEMRCLPFRDGSFDAVVCLEAIEHVTPSDAAAFLEECARVLRPGGLVVISTPLRQQGRHSGNPWHLVEYSQPEIGGLLERVLEPLEVHVEPGQDAPVFLLAGRLRPERSPAAVCWDSSQAGERAARWLAEMADGDGFRFAPGCPTTVGATSMGVLLAEGLGALARLPVPPQAAAAAIQKAQDAETGLFLEPLLGEIPLEGDLHDEEYFRWTTTYLALHALDALGEKPLHGLAFLKPFLEEGRAAAWLEGLDWSNPWRESNRIMHLLSGLLFLLKWEGQTSAAAAYHEVLDWLDAHQDPRTGLWGTDRGASVLNAVAGAYHFVPFYRYARRPVRGWSRIVDACLQIQQEDGLFGPAPGGGACEDTDAIDLLCTAARVQKRISPEIRRALTRAFWAIWNMQREDGSFPYANVGGEATYRYSSWPAMEARVNGGDLWATWFRLAALHTIRTLLGEDLPPLGAWTFRRFPALGFHLADTAVPQDAETAHRLIWFRPLPAPPPSPKPRVAAVVTCYNLGEYIFEALASLCRQTLKDLEAVIVDDGSTDTFTVARLDALAEDGWRVIRTMNRGLPAARNLGIAATRAPYVCCLDADDILRPEYFEKAVETLDANPRAGFVSCFYSLFDEAQGAYRYTRPRLPEMLARNEAVVASVFRRQAWAEAGGYCESLPAMQDWDFWISILEKGWEGRVLPEVLFEYRIRHGSMYSTTRKPANFARISAMIHARHAEIYQKYFLDVLRLKARIFAENVDYCLKLETDFRQALKEARREHGAARGVPAASGEQAEQAVGRAAVAPPPVAIFPTPSLWQTARWVWRRLGDPGERMRPWANLLLFLRVLLSASKRRLWYSQFRPLEYIACHPEVAHARIHASVHYAFAGAWEGANASGEFSSFLYWLRNPDVAAAGLNPLLHWVVHGREEGRRPIPHRVGMALWDFPAEMLADGSETAEPVISVVVPCFQLGRYVEEALASVIRQTFAGLEILLVEGGSTDGETPARVRQIERARIPGLRTIYRDRPCLAGDNRNFAIGQARGRYICCLDADDQLDPVYLETALFLAEFGGYDFVYPSVRLHGDGQGQWRVRDPEWPEILRHNLVSTVALFRREAWEAVGGYRDWGTGENYLPEDWDLWVRMLAEGFRGAALPEPLMHYRIRERSLSRHETGGENALSSRLAAANAGLFRLPRPRPRPLPPPERLRWSCLESTPGETVMLVIPFFSVGGAERIFTALLEEWRRRGVPVLAVTTRRPDPGAPDHTDRLRTLTRHVYPLEGLFPGRQDVQRDFLYFLLRRYRPRCIFAAGSDFFYWAMPAVRRYFPEIIIIDQLFNDQVFVGKNRDFSAFLDCTCVPSRAMAQKLAGQFQETDERIAVIPHGTVLPDPSHYAAGAFPAGFPAHFAGHPVVGFFGRFSPEKGALDFVQIATLVHQRFPHVRFVMTGEGPQEAAVRAAVRKAGLADAFALPGFVDDVHAWMAAAEVVVVPSRLDGMPLIVFEAQALEKPLVASSVGSIPEVIEDGVTGVLCEPGNPAAFAEAVCRLLESESLRLRMGRAARSYALREHSRDRMLERYFRLFEELAARHAARSR
ncbi:MAG: glycosyltransferase [Bryobacteraceae bacterium]|nr:glycosyltransferase [Bryobacteraceae bacterium]